jgi:xanthine dehydrogenase YagT iron-sulfur-binding subunit
LRLDHANRNLGDGVKLTENALTVDVKPRAPQIWFCEPAEPFQTDLLPEFRIPRARFGPRPFCLGPPHFRLCYIQNIDSGRNNKEAGVSRKKEPEEEATTRAGLSRRGFIRGVGLGSGALGAGVLEREAAAQAPGAQVAGPGAAPVTLKVNGKEHKLSLEPRVTLLDALRDRLDYTGAKKVCDRGTCGACTVMLDGKAVYACNVLAIEAQGKEIQTVESLSEDGAIHPLIKAFVDNDAQQCGFCTPGVVMAAKGFLEQNPSPTYEQVKAGLGGNLCRCGTYMGVRRAVLQAAKEMKGAQHA